MWFELFIAAALLCAGNIVFGRFEAEAARVRRIAKAAVFLAATAMISARWGREAALAWVFGGMALGVGVHLWWTHRNGIGFWDPEPWDRYAALRGWTRQEG